MKTVICRDVFGNKYQTPVEDLEIRVGVYAVIIKDEKILLTHQWDGFGIIGGTMEKGELVEETLIREVKEETGLLIVPDKIIYQTTTFFKRNKDSVPRQSVQLYFSHSKLSGKISLNHITESEKAYTQGKPEWISLRNIDKIVFRHSVDLKILLNAYNKIYKNK